MLRKLGELIIEAGLIRELDTGTLIYRARPHALGVVFDRAADLGTAPQEDSFANRMSPAGIPLFYGAFDADTAMREAWAGPAAGKELVSVGRFANSEPLPVIDLASIPEIPSIFDKDHRYLRPPLWFLYEFSERISAPVRKAARSESEMIAYVPTQIVSEYFGRPSGVSMGARCVGCSISRPRMKAASAALCLSCAGMPRRPLRPR
jgi:hypothetical protein